MGVKTPDNNGTEEELQGILQELDHIVSHLTRGSQVDNEQLIGFLEELADDVEHGRFEGEPVSFAEEPMFRTLADTCTEPGCDAPMASDMPTISFDAKYYFCSPEHAEEHLEEYEPEMIILNDPQGTISETGHLYCPVDTPDERIGAINEIRRMMRWPQEAQTTKS